MSAHTPGPWSVTGSDSFGAMIVANHTSAVIASWPMQGASEQVCIDARLIAAAPDLLTELGHLVRLLEPVEQSGSLNIPGLATLNGARAAIAKAEGK